MSGGFRRTTPVMGRLTDWLQYEVLNHPRPPRTVTSVSAAPSPQLFKGITKFRSGSGSTVSSHLTLDHPLLRLVRSESKNPDAAAEFELQTPITYMFDGQPPDYAFRLQSLTVSLFKATSGDLPDFFRLHCQVHTHAGYHITETPKAFWLKLAFQSAPSETPTLSRRITFNVWDEADCQDMEAEQHSDHLPSGLSPKYISGIHLQLPSAIKLQRTPRPLLKSGEEEEENIQWAQAFWQPSEKEPFEVYEPTHIPGVFE